MCGIAGFFGAFRAVDLEAANRLQAHRGPDDSGTYFDAESGVGLAHVRLAIQDLSPLGHQPMLSPDGNVVLVFNGEIYNFRELRHELSAVGYTFRGHSDTEVILNLYRRLGMEMLGRLNGIFALAIWDRSSGTLLLARDGMGVKPLYVTQSTHGFAFASEIKALRALMPDGLGPVDPIALRDHLTYLWCPGPRTLLQRVQKLKPGLALIIRDGQVVRDCQFSKMGFDDPIESLTFDSAVSQVRSALKTAVSRQMVADVPVGAFLSGGLDSSAVVAMAREVTGGDRLACFSIELNGRDAAIEGMTDDLPYARKVARHLDVDLHVVRAGPEMADLLPDMIYHLDEPQADPAPIHVMLISRLAREHGIKVLLSGAGGDDIFTGYRRHRALMLEPYWAWLPLGMRQKLASWARNLPTSSPRLRRLGKAFQYAGLEGDARLASYFNWLAPDRVAGLFSTDLWVAADNSLEVSLRDLSPKVPDLNRMLFLECRHFLADHNLNYTDKMSMASGVEVRVPLLDPDLVSLAARLTLKYKQHGREGKWIFKKAMEGILPQDIIYRPKTGFGAPLRAWLHGPLRPLVSDLLCQAAVRRRGWFDAAAIEKLIHDDRQGTIDASYTLFALLCIELWAQRFVDG